MKQTLVHSVFVYQMAASRDELHMSLLDIAFREEVVVLGKDGVPPQSDNEAAYGLSSHKHCTQLCLIRSFILSLFLYK